MPGSMDIQDAGGFEVGDLEAGMRLQDAVRRLVSRFSSASKLDFQCLFGAESLHLPRWTEEACYRVCRQALDNASRHAHARRITVELVVRHGRLVLRIADDGVGFELGQQGGGVLQMAAWVQAAGGRFELRSAPGAGTCVSALFPMESF